MATSSNRFEKVDDPRPDNVTLVLWDQDGQAHGHVLGPVAAESGEPPLVFAGEDATLSAYEALAIACHLGNELGRHVVVIDPQRVWQPGWGQLQSPAGQSSTN